MRKETSAIDQDGRQLSLSWNYTRAEIIADGVVHALGVVLGMGGAVVLVHLTTHAGGGTGSGRRMVADHPHKGLPNQSPGNPRNDVGRSIVTIVGRAEEQERPLEFCFWLSG
jgi:hypothetical protein